jgi:tetratricopeptide (TPR) repeat protein
MSRVDSWGVPVATASATAEQHLATALRDFIRLTNDPVGSLEAALRADPDWGLALAFRSYLDIFSQRAHGVRAAVDRLSAHAESLAHAPERERLHAQAAWRWAHNDLEGALRTLGAAIVLNPRDLLAIRIAHDLSFFLGDGKSLRDVVARALFAWTPEDDAYGLLQGMYAFGLEENGEYARAERSARLALELDQGDVWATHALTHVLEMQGRVREGEAFLEESGPYWRDSFFAVHNWWHLSLFYIESNKLDGALALYDGPIRQRRSEEWLDLVDACALLWRLSLLGINIGNRAQELAVILEQRITEAIYPFNDMHAVMAFSLSGRHSLADTLITHRSQSTSGSAQFALERAGLDLLRGFSSFARGNYDQASMHLWRARPNTSVIGGSHAQRDVVDQTLLVSCARGADASATALLSSERRERKHWSDASITRLASLSK